MMARDFGKPWPFKEMDAWDRSADASSRSVEMLRCCPEVAR